MVDCLFDESVLLPAHEAHVIYVSNQQNDLISYVTLLIFLLLDHTLCGTETGTWPS
jgi:hypothetical protein